MPMSEQAKVAVIAAIQDAGYEYRAYTGRGMYGAQCLGVDVDNALQAIVRIMAALNHTAGYTLNEVTEHMADVKSDSMGQGQILYFPSIEM